MWAPLVRRLKTAPGYLWHRSHYTFPLGIGLVVAFDSRESLMEFAKTPEHQAIMHWLVGTDEHSGTGPAGPGSAPVAGGFIRTFTADRIGYANGTWRADTEELRMIGRWEDQRDGDRRPEDLDPRFRRRIQGAGKILAAGRAVVGGGLDALAGHRSLRRRERRR